MAAVEPARCRLELGSIGNIESVLDDVPYEPSLGDVVEVRASFVLTMAGEKARHVGTVATEPLTLLGRGQVVKGSVIVVGVTRKAEADEAWAERMRQA